MRFIYTYTIFCCLLSTQTYANDFLTRFNLIENHIFSNDLGSGINGLENDQLITVFDDIGGITIDVDRLSPIITNLDNLDLYQNALGQSNAQASIVDIKAIFPDLNQTEAEALFGLISTNSTNPSPESYLASATADDLALMTRALQKEIDELVEEANRPSLPSSPTGISIDRIIRRGHENMRRTFVKPKTSGNFFEDLRVIPTYSYTEYKDDTVNGTGQIHDFYLTLGTTIFEDTDLSFSLSHGETDNNDDVEDYHTKAWGGDFLIQHKLNETYSVGVFGFYQQIDMEGINGNTFGTGGGALFSTFHAFESFDIITVHTITKSYYDYGHDTLWVSSGSLSRSWTDKFSTGITATFTDSIKDSTEGDNTYWMFGGDLTYLINDTMSIFFSYDKTFSINDYESETYTISMEVLF